MLLAVYEPAIPASERVQTHSLDCATAGNASDSCVIVDMPVIIQLKIFLLFFFYLQVFVCIQAFFRPRYVV
jgi:hypothetical protein